MPEPNDDPATPNGIATEENAPSETKTTDTEAASHAASAPPAEGSSMISRLRAEAEEAGVPERKAVLLHEAGELLERVAGDELGAAKDYLAAYNADAAFREPLEALVRILERRRSLKNLGRVLESLSRSADTPEERARALRARATHAADVTNDRDEAHALLEEAADADSTDPTTWLMLELDAGLRSDPEGRKRALSRRVELATDPRWAALLRIDLAELRAAEGDVDDALDVLTEVVSSPDEAAFHACEVAERLAHGGERGDREAWALVQRAEIVLESVADPPGPRGRGVPESLRRAGVAADAFVRAAAAYRNSDRFEDEVATLDRAVQVDPSATMPNLARISAAARLGDLDGAAKLAGELLGRSGRPDLAPALWLTVAEAALARGDRDGVLDACAKLLEAPEGAEPRALVAKTLLTDLLLDGSDPARLGTLVEGDAAARATDEGKMRGYVLAAVVWALFASDGEAARKALDKARALGGDAKMIAHAECAIAATTPTADHPIDEAARDASAGKLRALTDDVGIRADLDVDDARAHLARSDLAGAMKALERIAPEEPHGLLSRVLRLALAGDGVGDDLLSALSAGVEGDAALAFAVARALRAARADDAVARGAAVEAISSTAVEDEIVALTRAAAAVRERPSEAAAVLRDMARTLADPEGRDVVRVAAALLLARAGALDVALELALELESEAQQALAPARAVWQRLLAKSDDEKRREALEVTGRDLFAGGGWSALERAIDRLVAPDSGVEGPPAEVLLGELAQSDDHGLARASLLLQAAWPDGNVTVGMREDATRALAALGADAARMVARAALSRASRDADSSGAVEAAQTWFRAGGGTPAAIELLVSAELAADSEAEVRGRRALARSLTGPAAHLVAASASMAAHVAGLPAPPVPSVRDDASGHALALADLELAPPGCDPARRERTLLDVAPLIPGAASTMIELAAWSALARNDYDQARTLFVRVLELSKDDEPRSAVEGAVETELLAAAGKPTPAWAELVEKLAAIVEISGDVTGATELWEQVGHAWWDQLGNQARGERALAEAFDRDPHRKTAFEPVFRAVRTRKEDDRLLALVARRLEATDEPPEMARLFWEQARVLRAKGDRDGALSSLENVTMLEPDHVGALALSAEIYLGRQMFAEAATALDRMSRQPGPVQQKLGAGIGAADLYETKLDAPDKALDVLVALDNAGLSDPAIHERIAKAAARAQAWIPATKYLEKLVKERTEASGRIEAARLVAAIYRDRLDDGPAAVPALVSILKENPDDAEALEQLLDAPPPLPSTREVLSRSLRACRAGLCKSPVDVRVSRLVSRVSEILGDHDSQQVALGILAAIDEASPAEAAGEKTLLARIGNAPTMALAPASSGRLAEPGEEGPFLQLFRAMAETIAEALGPSLDALGVGRRERVDARAVSPLRNEVAGWAGAFGINEFEFYVGGKEPKLIQGVPGETPAIVIGAGVHSPLSLSSRARLVRQIVALERGTTIVSLRDDVAVAAIIVASCALVDVQLKTPPYPVLAETQRLLGKAVSRKVKKAIPETAAAVAREVANGFDPRSFRGLALRTLDRAAALASAEPAAVLAEILGEQFSAAGIKADARAQALLRFIWSDDYILLRKQLGLGIG